MDCAFLGAQHVAQTVGMDLHRDDRPSSVRGRNVQHAVALAVVPDEVTFFERIFWNRKSRLPSGKRTTTFPVFAFCCMRVPTRLPRLGGRSPSRGGRRERPLARP